MRDYAKVAPTFWTGSTGRTIRDLGRDAQVVALYLLTCPSSNMLGLYYMTLPSLCHETGIPFEGASKALRSLSEAHFAHYDESTEYIYVPKMAEYQVGEELAATDLRCKGIYRELLNHRKSPFFNDFYKRYRKAFHLPALPKEVSPFEAPSKPLRSQEQEQEQEQEHDKHKEPRRSRGGGKQQPDQGGKTSDAPPSPLDSPAFTAAWSGYIAYRAERKLPALKPISVRTQWARMAEWGLDAALVCIRDTIANGWNGIVAPKGGVAANGAHPAKAPTYENVTGKGQDLARRREQPPADEQGADW